MRKLLRVKYMALLTVAITVLLLVSCGGKKGQEDGAASKEETAGKTTITFWRTTGTPEEDQYYKTMLSNFSSSTIEVKEITFPDNTFHDTIKASVLSDDLPDILWYDSTFVGDFAYNGIVIPLDSLINSDLKNDILLSLLYKNDSKIYAIGQFESGLSFWANKSMLEDAGVRIPTYEEPWDKVEFEDALAKLKASGVEYPLDLKINYGPGYWVYSYQPIAKSFAGDWWNPATGLSTGMLNGKDTVASIQYIQDLVKQGYVKAAQSNDDDFYIKKISGLSLVGHWMLKPHTDNLGEDAILIPLPDFGNGSWTDSGSLALGITTKAQKRGVEKHAMEYINYLLSGDAIEKLTAINGAVPGRKSLLAKLPDYQPGGKLYLYRQQLEGAKVAVRPVTPAFGTIQNYLGEAIVNVLAGANAQEELDNAAQQIDQVIQDNGY